VFGKRADQERRQVARGEPVLEIDEHAGAQTESPVCEQRIKSGLRVGIGQHEQPAALFDVLADPVLFFSSDHAARSGQHEHRGVLGNRGFLKKRNGPDLIALFGQGFFGDRQAVAFPILHVAFAVPLDEDDAFFGVFGNAQQGSGQFDFRGRGHPDGPPAALENRGVAPKHSVVLRELRLFFGIDEFHREFGRRLSITLQPVFIGLVPRIVFPGEHRDLDVLLQRAERAIGLGSQREALVLGQVPANGMAGRQEIHDGQNGREQQNGQHAVQAHLGRATAGQGFHRLEMQREKHQQAAQREQFGDGDGPEPVGSQAVGDGAADGQDQSDQSERKRFPAHFQRADSTTR